MLSLNKKLREQSLTSATAGSSSSSPCNNGTDLQHNAAGISTGFRRIGGGKSGSSSGGGNQIFPIPSQPPPKDNTSRISIRDKLLCQEVTELSQSLPSPCHVHFPSESELCNFDLTVRPEKESLYSGGSYRFHISVPLEYNNLPPKVKCLTRIWHPNISEDGSVCLSLLRETALDGMGWSPTRKLKDVVWGLNSLFTDLLDFDDPLNIEAAEHYRKDQADFQRKIRDYIRRYCDSSN